MQEAEKTLVVFYSKNENLKFPEAAILLPTQLNPEGLNELVNSILIPTQSPSTGNTLSNSNTTQRFNFIIDNKFLKSSLGHYLEQNSLSTENTLKIQVVEAQSQPELQQQLHQDDWISTLNIKGDLILQGSYDSCVKILSTTGKEILSTKNSKHSIKSATWVGDDLVVVGDLQSNICGYSVGSLQKVFSCVGHSGSVESMTFGSHLITGSYDKSIILWDIEKDKLNTLKTSRGKKQKLSDSMILTPSSTLLGHNDLVSGLTLNDNTLYSCSWDHSIRVWDLETSTNVKTMNSEKVVLCIDYTSTGILLTGHEDGYIRQWDPRSEISIKTKMGPLMNWVSSVKHNSGNEFQFCTTSYDGSCKVWDMRSRTSMLTCMQSEDKLFTCDWKNGVIAVGGEDSQLSIFNV